MEKRIKRFPDEFYFFTFLPLLSQLPFSFAYRLAGCWGRRLFRSEDATCEIICRNVASLQNGRKWPSPESIAQSTFENLIYEDLDTYYYRTWRADNLHLFFEFEGLSHLERLAEECRGAILMTAHIGAPCAALVALALKGFPVTHVSREYSENREIPHAFRRFALRKISMIESRLGRPLINAIGHRPLHGHQSSLEIVECFRSHHLVSMALDVNPDWVAGKNAVRFFGRTAHFSPIPIRLATYAKVPVVPYFAVRDKIRPHRHTVIIQPPLSLSGNLEENLQEAVSRFEGVLSRYPDQWFSWDSLTHFLQSTN